MKTQEFSEEIKTKLGKSIYGARRKAGLTQAEVAAAIGVSQSLISDWEKGNTVPLAINIYQLARLFNISPLIFNPFEDQENYNVENINHLNSSEIHEEIAKLWAAIQRLEEKAEFVRQINPS
jgi:transcriptional regulator with XRE-family HTH domain